MMKLRKIVVLAFGLVLALTGSAFAQGNWNGGQQGNWNDGQSPSPDLDEHIGEDFREDCEDEWDDSDASDHCTGTVSSTTAKLSLEGDVSDKKCGLSVICAVTVGIHETTTNDEGIATTTTTNTTFTKNFSPEKPLDKIADLTLCFRPDVDDATYVLRLRYNCKSDETDAATAVSGGLDAVESVSD